MGHDYESCGDHDGGMMTNNNETAQAKPETIDLSRKCSFCGSNLADTGVDHPDGILCTNCSTIN